jgi:hypothetical protein
MDLVKFRTGMGRWTVVMTTQIIFRLTGRALMMVNRLAYFCLVLPDSMGLGTLLCGVVYLQCQVAVLRSNSEKQRFEFLVVTWLRVSRSRLPSTNIASICLCPRPIARSAFFRPSASKTGHR